MYIYVGRRIISVMIIIALLVSQVVVVSGTSSSVQYSNAAQYASSGKLNCFPDKGEWGTNDDKFYIEYNSKSGDELKPVNGDSDFTYCWYMPLDGVKAQIDNGLQYNVAFDVFGHLIDGDTANIYIDFWVPYGEGITGFVTNQYLQEDVDLWKHRSFLGYIPENATYMRLRLTGTKAKDFVADSDCAIFFRNIEVHITDDVSPVPAGIEYGASYELGTAEARGLKEYYGVGSDVYWDVEFNEPVFVNDPEYLAYARGLSNGERVNFANNDLAKKFTNDKTVLGHVLNNNGSTAVQQFGELKLKFKYKNSDGTDKIGYAVVVDRSLYNTDSYGNDYSKQIKFKYTVQQGDDFQADDIYEMELQGGIITDNAYNMMPDEKRKISFDSNADSGINTLYRKYFQNFIVETAAPVLVDINGRNPDGLISASTDLGLYLKFSEPVYMTMSDEAFEKNNIDKHQFNDLSYGGLLHAGQYSLNMNSKYVDSVGNESSAYGAPTAYYDSGNGTTMLKFGYYVHENKFDPLEITGSEINESGVSLGEIYVMDAAGNTAPLIQNNNVRLSDNKYYVADANPPEISVTSMKAEEAKGGFYLRIDVSDKGSGVDYDKLRFGFGYADSLAQTIWNNVKPLVPGKLYHSEELYKLFGLEAGKSDIFRIMVDASDKKGNDHYSPKYGAGWYTEINIDTNAPTLDRCSVDNYKYSSMLGSFTAVFKDGTSGAATSGLGSSPNIKYKWVSAGFNPDTEDWLTPSRAYSAGVGIYYADGPSPAGYIYGDADLYLKAVDLAGNEAVFYVPKALLYSSMTNIADRMEFDFQTWDEGRIYACKVKRFDRSNSGVYKAYKGLWYCLTAEGTIPEFSETSGLWKYKEADTVQTSEYDANPRERNGYYFMHVIAVDNDGKPIGAATSPTMLFFDFKDPVVKVEAEKKKDGSWVVRPYTTDNTIRREDLKLQYSFNYTYDWKVLPQNGEIIISKELQKPNAWLLIRVAAANGYYGDMTFGPYSSTVSKLTTPYINYYRGTRYTNENFMQLLLSTEADEFSYSYDNTSWSNWIPLEAYERINGYDFSDPCVPLPQKEGEITFYTKYRKTTGEVTDAVKSTVIRDVTPPTGDVNITSYNNSTYWYTATPTNLKDNLCSSGEIKIVGDKTEIIARGEPYYFVIEDGAGNKGEIKAYVAPEPVVIVVPDIDKDDDDDPEPADTEAPGITVTPNGNSNNTKSVSVKITATDNKSVSKVEYAFSEDEDPAGVEIWSVVANKSTVTLTSVSGTYYLHVRAADSSDNVGTFTSNPFYMVENYEEPYLVYSGEEEGYIRTFLVSEEPITVTEAVYDLKRGDPQHTFNYTYDADDTEASITTDWQFSDEYSDEDIEWLNDMFKPEVNIEPYEDVTSGAVKVTLESQTKDEGGQYLDYDHRIELDPGDNVKVLLGRVRTGYSIDSPVAYVITEDAPKIYNLGFAEELDEAGYGLDIYKAEITTEENTTLEYSVDDGAFTIYVGHIVEDEALEDNVNIALANGKMWSYAPWALLASANRYAGMLRAYVSLSGADLTPPVGQVSYTTADPKEGPVTANLTVSDDSSGKITISSKVGGSHVFDTNGQFIFEFVDEAGNKGRALAEVSTINNMASGVDISYSTWYPTKENVKVTMTPEEGTTMKNGDIAAVLENGGYSFVATDNGHWKFIFANDLGIETAVTAIVDNIDRTPPKLSLEYVKDTFNKTVTAFVRSEETIWPASVSTLSHFFKANGQHTFKVVDEAGNDASITATVDNIEALGSYKSNIDVKVNYSTQASTNKPVKLTLTSDKVFAVLNNNGRAEMEVKKSGKYQFIVRDSVGLIKIVEAVVKNIDTEAPVITLGYPESISVVVGDPIDTMNFTAVDNFDGDVKWKVKAEGNINTQQPGTYQATDTVTDSYGNTTVKTLTVRVLGSDEQIITVNGIKYESEPLMLSTSQLQITARGFTGKVGIKWTKGYETVAFFKDYGTEAASETVPVSEKGWYTLYVYDNERSSRLVHVFITDLGGGQ